VGRARDLFRRFFPGDFRWIGSAESAESEF
jgi:hypothetical protein